MGRGIRKAACIERLADIRKGVLKSFSPQVDSEETKMVVLWGRHTG